MVPRSSSRSRRYLSSHVVEGVYNGAGRGSLSPGDRRAEAEFSPASTAGRRGRCGWTRFARRNDTAGHREIRLARTGGRCQDDVVLIDGVEVFFLRGGLGHDLALAGGFSGGAQESTRRARRYRLARPVRRGLRHLCQAVAATHQCGQLVQHLLDARDIRRVPFDDQLRAARTNRTPNGIRAASGFFVVSAEQRFEAPSSGSEFCVRGVGKSSQDRSTVHSGGCAAP